MRLGSFHSTMRPLLQAWTSLVCLIYFAQHAASFPHPRAKPIHEVHVDLIDTIFQIPIQTLNAVGNLLKNVHSAKRNFLSIQIHVDKPDGSHPSRPSYPFKPDSYPSSKPESYPSNKPNNNPTSKPDSGFPDYQPDSNPILPSTSVRPVSGGMGVTVPDTKPQIDNEYPSPSTTGGIDSGLLGPDSETTPGFRPPSGYNPSEKTTTLDRVPPAPAVQPPYTRATVAQPLSLDIGNGLFDKSSSNREKNFKEYVQRKLAERNLQDNRISQSL